MARSWWAERHAGHTALFPDEVKAWEAQLRNTETLAELACRLAELDGVSPAEPTDPDVHSARVTEIVAALEKLGEGRQAFTIATAWLRSKLTASDPWVAVGQPGTGSL